MGDGEKREALRVPCSIPLRVYGQFREMAGRIIDISRTGLRIRLPMDALLTAPSPDFTELAQAVEQVLGTEFLADLHHEMLGQLIRRRLRPVRLGSIDMAQRELDVGCQFDEPLRDEETMMLGIGLPPVGVTTAAAYRDVPPPTRRGREAEDLERTAKPRSYEGVLHPSPGVTAAPLRGESRGMLDRKADLQVLIDDIPGAFQVVSESLARALDTLFGSKPRLEVLDGVHMVWAGPVAIVDVTVHRTEGGHARLHLEDASPRSDV